MSRAAEPNFDGRMDPSRGDAVPSGRPESWDGFLEARREADVPDEFLADRRDEAPQTREDLGNRQATEPADFATLYRRAFTEYGTRALWNKRLLDAPDPEDALVVARALRIEGDREARRLAELIEQACRAAL